MFEELEKDIEHFSSHCSILLMGDLSFDNELNSHGERLLELCKSADLRILSLIVARVKFEPESSSSPSQVRVTSQVRVIFFHIFFPIILFDYTVNIIVKKMSDS